MMWPIMFCSALFGSLRNSIGSLEGAAAAPAFRSYKSCPYKESEVQDGSGSGGSSGAAGNTAATELEEISARSSRRCSELKERPGARADEQEAPSSGIWSC